MDCAGGAGGVAASGGAPWRGVEGGACIFSEHHTHLRLNIHRQPSMALTNGFKFFSPLGLSLRL